MERNRPFSSPRERTFRPPLSRVPVPEVHHGDSHGCSWRRGDVERRLDEDRDAVVFFVFQGVFFVVFKDDGGEQEPITLCCGSVADDPGAAPGLPRVSGGPGAAPRGQRWGSEP